MNVNVNVRIGSAAVRRPQWFGDRPQKGRPDDEGNEEYGHHGGKRPRPDRDEEESGEENGHNGGQRPRPPRPERNGSR